jgi:hypothetical protein
VAVGGGVLVEEEVVVMAVAGRDEAGLAAVAAGLRLGAGGVAAVDVVAGQARAGGEVAAATARLKGA